MARFLLRLGRFIQSLAIMVMRPDDLVEFSRQDYSTLESLGDWSSEQTVDSGLNPLESACLEKIPIKNGRVLLLGLGGGRDAIPLAQRGFEVTGVDYIPEMVQRAKTNAAKRGVKIEGLVQEISEIDALPDSYDLVWLTNSMYSSVPTRRRRVAMLQRLHGTLRPGGFLICTFHWEKRREPSQLAEWARKLFAIITLGNLSYERGDILWLKREFLHVFTSEAALRSEFEDGGLTLIYLQIPESGVEGGALLQPRKLT
jgi:SAM-dependent methyltransferase